MMKLSNTRTTTLALALLLSLGDATNKHELFERRARHASEALQSLLSGEGHTMPYNHVGRQLQAEVNCDHQAVNDWVNDHVEGGRCEDFGQVVGGTELCRQYERYTDPAKCFELEQQQSFTVGQGGQGPNDVEQCLFFVNHLLPHPYFLDLDSILPVFGSGFDYPTHHECQQSETHDCQVQVVFENEIPQELLPENVTAPPTPAPYTETVNCTRCDFFYDSDEVCFEADCDWFACQGDAPEPLAEGENRTVDVCFRNTRSDIFGFTEHRIGPYYGCAVSTEEKQWTTTFDLGVTNIQTIQFKLGEHTDDLNGIGLDFCELQVDGVPCRSCTFCGVNDTNPHVAIDCENIVEGGKTSCDSQTDFLYGISRKLMILEEGYGKPPTQAPTTPTPLPSPTPTKAPVEAPFPEEQTTEVLPKESDDAATPNDGGDAGFGGMEADALDGPAFQSGAKATTSKVVASLVLLSLGFFY